jgi:hypothetical protein
VSEQALTLSDQLVQLLALEFEALEEAKTLDRFASLQPGKNDLLARVIAAVPFCRRSPKLARMGIPARKTSLSAAILHQAQCRSD